MDKTPGTWTYFTKPHYVDGRCWRSIQMDNFIAKLSVFFQNVQGLPPLVDLCSFKQLLMWLDT